MTIYIVDHAGLSPARSSYRPFQVSASSLRAMPLNCVPLAEPLRAKYGLWWRGSLNRLRTTAAWSTAPQPAKLCSMMPSADLPEGLTPEPRPSADHRWNAGDWEFDAALQATNRRAVQYTLCHQVDNAADAARLAVAGDPAGSGIRPRRSRGKSL